MHHGTGASDGVFHSRGKFLPQFYSHFVEAFLGFIELSLNGVVLDIILFCDRRTLFESHVGRLLLLLYHVDVTGKSGDDRRCTCAIGAHGIEHRCQHTDVAQLMQT